MSPEIWTLTNPPSPITDPVPARITDKFDDLEKPATSSEQFGACFVIKVVAYDHTALRFVDWNVVLRATRAAKHRFGVASGVERREGLLLAVQIADWTRKSFMRLQAMPAVDKSLDFHRWSVDHFEMI
jgi:hypothetical protein